MSRIKHKTSEVLEEGRVSRETWTPKLGSAPLRVYRWWLRETDKFVWQENFCHFWRVVLIWAPLLRLRKMMRLDKLSMPKVDSSTFNKWYIAFIVSMLLLVLAIPTVRLWGELSWWSLLAGPLLLIVSLAVAIGLALVFVFAGAGVLKMVKAVKYRRVPQIQGMTQRVRRAGRTGGEFIVLTAQVIRVKKWKVCPLVEIPPET